MKRTEIINRLGVKVDEGIDKLNIGWAALDYIENKFKVFEKLENNLRLGDLVELRKVGANWEIYSNDQICGELKRGAYPKTEEKILKGFLISSIERWTYAETLIYDSKKEGRDFANKWCKEAKKRGYIYLVDFAGFGQ